MVAVEVKPLASVTVRMTSPGWLPALNLPVSESTVPAPEVILKA
jgi:hypothetical protein